MKKRVLLVDDEIDIVDVLSQNIEDLMEDVSVDIAQNGLEALEMISKQAYDAILSDINMPKMNGIDLLKSLRDSGNHTPFIILTGHGDLPLAVKALRLGAIDFMHKPFDLDRILEGLSECININEKLIEKNRALEDIRQSKHLTDEQVESLRKLNLSMANLATKKRSAS